jgi:hypothetical protein
MLNPRGLTLLLLGTLALAPARSATRELPPPAAPVTTSTHETRLEAFLQQQRPPPSSMPSPPRSCAARGSTGPNSANPCPS